MENKKIIIIVATVVVLIIAGIGIYYLINPNFNFTKNVASQDGNITGNSKNVPVVKTPTLEEANAQNKTNYPDTITGVINFLDNGGVIKTTVKTADGKEYTLSPNQPKIIYESFGAKNGSTVQVQGKIIDNNTLNFLTLKVIKK